MSELERCGAAEASGRDDMSDPQVLSFRPEPDQYAWMFGGAAPVARTGLSS
jgi:hypothetical protein